MFSSPVTVDLPIVFPSLPPRAYELLVLYSRATISETAFETLFVFVSFQALVEFEVEFQDFELDEVLDCEPL